VQEIRSIAVTPTCQAIGVHVESSTREIRAVIRRTSQSRERLHQESWSSRKSARSVASQGEESKDITTLDTIARTG
jgi:hypothetical protein